MLRSSETSNSAEGLPGLFENVVRSHAGRLLGTARRILRDEAEAQDAVQDALLCAHRGLERFRGDNKMMSAWLFKITVNAALLRLRKRKRLAEESLEDLEPKFLQDGHRANPDPAWCTDPEDRVGTKQLCGLLYQEMARLPEIHRDVLILRDIQGLSTEEAAEVLEIQPNALKVRLHRARCALRQLMSKYLAGEPAS